MTTKSSNFYGSLFNDHLIYVRPLNAIISLSKLLYSSSWVVDSFGNVYISRFSCPWVTKCTPNPTSGALVDKSSTGDPDGDSQSLRFMSALALSESNSFLYVADHYNHRIQRFILGGWDIGVTVADDNGQDFAANQLDRPIDIYLSRFDGTL